MNDLMSGGIHRLWKADLIRAIRPRNGLAVLDVGGGTGDIAFGVLATAGCNVTVCDINAEMVAVGGDRAVDRGLLSEPFWTCGNAEQLPVSDETMDVYVTAFCMRNVTHLPTALQEAKRVLKPGGHFLCLEFSTVALPFCLKYMISIHSRCCPFWGRWWRETGTPYQYLAESIRRFPNQAAFASRDHGRRLGAGASPEC